MTQPQQGRPIPIVFVGADEVPILFVNQMVIQHVQNEFILTLAQIQPPILLGSPEERQSQVEKITHVSAQVVARIGLTRARLAELIAALQTNLSTYDSQQEEGESDA